METKRDDTFEQDALDNLCQVLDEIKCIEQELLKAKERFKYSLLTLPHGSSERRNKISLLVGRYHLWFREKEFIAKSLTEIFDLIKVNQISKSDDLQYFTETCDQCSSSYEIASFSQKDLLSKQESIRYSRLHKIAVICPKCIEEQSAAGQQQLHVAKKRVQYRLLLQTMPYREYLQTPEWKQIREEKLKQEMYTCQICNARGGQLNVHHRTYERRGHEDLSDLIVLCQHCHGIFHTHGKLAKQD